VGCESDSSDWYGSFGPLLLVGRFSLGFWTDIRNAGLARLTLTHDGIDIRIIRRDDRRTSDRLTWSTRWLELELVKRVRLSWWHRALLPQLTSAGLDGLVLYRGLFRTACLFMAEPDSVASLYSRLGEMSVRTEADVTLVRSVRGRAIVK